jgi:hypothetical protein
MRMHKHTELGNIFSLPYSSWYQQSGVLLQSLSSKSGHHHILEVTPVVSTNLGKQRAFGMEPYNLDLKTQTPPRETSFPGNKATKGRRPHS